MNLIILLASTVILLIINLTSFIQVRREDAPQEFIEKPREANLSRLTANFVQEGNNWRAGEREVVQIKITSPEKFNAEATVYTLIVNFNPDQLAIEKVTKGDIWAQSNLLQSDIDNDKGELVFTLGKGFNNNGGTGKENLVTIEFLVKSGSGSGTEVVLERPSLYAREGKGGLIEAPPLKVVIGG